MILNDLRVPDELSYSPRQLRLCYILAQILRKK
ncbi:hypothetical protein SAMN04490210_5394 [Pseudomonas sp. bs2935]|nr:hypothetical protein SAMN04490210_5394 [Pseudomonas sp. bs2935]